MVRQAHGEGKSMVKAIKQAEVQSEDSLVSFSCSVQH